MRSEPAVCGGLLAALVLGGCASAPARTASEAERICFDKRDINMIRALDDRHALVKVSAGRHYLLTMDRTCVGMALARAIAITESTTRVCEDGTTLLSFEDTLGGPMRCRVDGIDAVADRNAAEDLIRSRE